jgi:hypothetical protein
MLSSTKIVSIQYSQDSEIPPLIRYRLMFSLPPSREAAYETVSAKKSGADVTRLRRHSTPCMFSMREADSASQSESSSCFKKPSRFPSDVY